MPVNKGNSRIQTYKEVQEWLNKYPGTESANKKQAPCGTC